MITLYSDETEKDKLDDHESHHSIGGELDEKKEKISFSKKKLDDYEIIAQAWLFWLAGFETTGNMLSFCFYSLAVNPDCQEKLYQEVSSSVDANGNIDYDTLTKLPYLDACLSETLRIYPALMALDRIVSENYTLPTTNIELPKGTIVNIPIYALHHDEKYYDQPEKFNPDRFLPENRHLIQPFTYFPFGAGPRSCVGMRFALLEAKLCLSQIIMKYKLVRCDKTDVPLLLDTLGGVMKSKRMIIAFEKRE